jgi:hypothetical protein
MSFVRDAGGISSSGFLEKRDVPVCVSINTADLDPIKGALSIYGERSAGAGYICAHNSAGNRKKIRKQAFFPFTP